VANTISNPPKISPMSQYTSEYPKDIGIDPVYTQFLESFYAISDTPDAHEEYVSQFTKNATLIMASKKCVGSSDILALRKGMWEKVSSRSHQPLKIFPFGEGSGEMMLYGVVDYVMKDGKKAGVDWAARGQLVKENGKVKWDYYQVYLDTAAQNSAK